MLGKQTSDYYLIIGRANSGKTTFAKRILEQQIEHFIPAILIDSDAIRYLFENKFHTSIGKWQNVSDCMYMAKRYMEMGIVPIIAIKGSRQDYREAMLDVLGGKGHLFYLEGGDDTDLNSHGFEEPGDEFIRVPDWRIK